MASAVLRPSIALGNRTRLVHRQQQQRRTASRPVGGGRSLQVYAGPAYEFGYRKDLESRVVLKELLGAGQYGRVYAAEDKQSGTKYAVKSIPKSLPGLDARTLANYRGKIRREVDTQIALGRSLNIVYLYDAYEDDTYVHLLLERCTGGNLWARRDIVEGNFNEAKAAEVVRIVLRTIAQCHAKNVAFRDIKPENFMYATPEPGSPLKLSDFGLAAPVQAGQKLTERCGTIYYVAPEVISMSYGPEADVWSAGVLAYQLLSGRLPFTDRVNEDRPVNKEIWHSILFDDVDLESSPWDTISPLAKDLVRRLLERDVRKRIRAADAAEHVWVREGGVTRDVALDGTAIARLQRFGTANALQQAALRMMAKGLDAMERSSGGVSAELQAVENLYDRMDPQRTGKVPRAAVEASLKADGYALAEEEWAQMLAQMDPQNSGSVTRDSFIASLVDWRAEAERVGANWTELARSAYDTFLEKGAASTEDRGLALDDVLDEVCLMEDDGTVCRAAVQDVLREADVNHDGHVDFDEWLKVVAPLQDDLGKYDTRLGGKKA